MSNAFPGLYGNPEIESIQKEIFEKRQRIIELLKQSAHPVTKPYVFVDWSNREVPLSDLFGDKNDLILIHNMGKGCRYCTLWADEINGISKHLENRAALAVISPNTPEVQKEFAESRGWRFKMLSDRDMDFSREMGFAYDKEGKTFAMPGYSTFHKSADGTIKRVGYDEFGPTDMYSSTWHFLEMLQDGENGWEPQYSYEN
ncbi:MAG TPA: DUF899 family protein [Candidatus Kapabacteria bacterium]|nr:DUF899 family protein [Candidatus Kapabacteria bacterium]